MFLIKLEEKYKKIFDSIHVLAEKNNILALYYMHCLGVKQNINKAIYWYQKAAKQCDVVEQYSFENMFFGGYGAKQIYELAAHYYSFVAEVKDKDVMYNSDVLYLDRQ